MAAVLVHSSSQKTDAKVSLSYTDLRHTSCGIRWTNTTMKSYSSFLLRYRKSPTTTWFSSPAISVAKGATKTYPLTGLVPDGYYFVRLERAENGKWVYHNQVNFRTKKIDANTSSSSVAAIIKWPKAYNNPTYRVMVYDQQPASGINPVKTLEQASITLSGTTHILTVAQLARNKTYHVRFNALEPEGTTGMVRYKEVGQVEFETSDLVSVQVPSYGATYANATWDGTEAGEDEEDGVAEYMIRAYRQSPAKWLPMSPWFNDSTKSYTVTGLEPGTRYLIRLHRKSVDNKTIYQSQKWIDTLTTDLEIVAPTTTTRTKVGWESMYSGSRYQVKYIAPGVSEKTFGGASGTTATEALLTNLVPGKTYTIKLHVVENGVSSLLDTLTTQTQVSPPFSVIMARYTTIQMRLQSPTSDATSYYFRTDIKGSSGGFQLSSTNTTTRDVRELSPGTTYKIYLYRFEHGSWVLQSRGNGQPSYITMSTKSFGGSSTSVATNTAKITWDQNYPGALYQIDVFNGTAGSGGSSFITYQDSEISGASATALNDRSVLVTSGLSKNTDYHAKIKAKEPNRQGTDQLILVKTIGFRTSPNATLQVVNIKSSYVDLSWTPGAVKEEDGVAEFKVRKIQWPNGSYSDATTWLPHTTSTARVSGLVPGKEYRLALVRMGVDGRSRTHAIVNVSTKSTVLRADNTTSTSVSVSWDHVYTGAQYQIRYSSGGGSLVTLGGGPISDNHAVISGLDPGTPYSIKLYVMENGTLVGSSLASLGTSLEVRTYTKYGGLLGILSLMALIISILMSRSRK